MIQLIAAVALMYLVVGAAGIWMVRKQRTLLASQVDQGTNERGERHG